ncbi:MAG: hypothetical protein QOD80_2060, partial [Verrucomicrobiota bacterium]
MTLPGQVINLRRPDFRKYPAQGRPVGQIAIVQKKRFAINAFAVAQMF